MCRVPGAGLSMVIWGYYRFFGMAEPGASETWGNRGYKWHYHMNFILMVVPGCLVERDLEGDEIRSGENCQQTEAIQEGDAGDLN